MRSRLFWRRSAAVAGTYASAALGFGATVVALHVFSTETFGRYALVLAATALAQSLLDLTVEEALVKFGFRFVTREDWGRLRRLFAGAIAFKLVGGLLATGLLLAFAPAANSLLHKHGLTTPLLIGAFIPLAQCTENVGGVAIVLRGRYDIRAFFLFVSMALRFTAIAVFASHGLTATITAMVVAQVIATTAVSATGWAAFHRFPQRPSISLAEERRDILSFVGQSTAATAVISLTAPLSLLVLGRVSTTKEVTYFRAAMSPQQAFAVVSAPARLILLTAQARDRCGDRGARLQRRVLHLLDVPLPPHQARAGAGRGDDLRGGPAVRVLIVSGIWPPDVGGPASHAPDVAEFLRGRGHDVEVVTTADSAPAPEEYPVRWVSRSLPVGVRHVRGAGLVRSRAL